jgi:2-isopropylmalate synthase
MRLVRPFKPFFDLKGFRVIVEEDKESGGLVAEATLKVVVDGKTEHRVAEGSGPVDALDGALRLALEKFYPKLKDMTLMDFKVRVIDARAGTAAKVRVFVNSKDQVRRMGHRGRLRQHHRSLLASPPRRRRIQTPQRRPTITPASSFRSARSSIA